MSATIQHTEDQKKKFISGILYQLELQLEKFIDEVKKSYALNEVGEKTPLVKKIEADIDRNPIESLFGLSSNIDSQILFFINNYTEKFLKSQNDIILSAFKLKSDNSLEQYYLIVLKEDSIENRAALFEYLDFYETQSISSKFPLNFKFTSQDLLNGFFIQEKIEL